MALLLSDEEHRRQTSCAGVEGQKRSLTLDGHELWHFEVVEQLAAFCLAVVDTRIPLRYLCISCTLEDLLSIATI